MMNNIKLVSGIGAAHTNEYDTKKPQKKLTPYLSIDFLEIQALVESPQQVDKAHAQWLIPSIYKSRTFKIQEQHGEYWLLWADLDKKPPALAEIGDLIELDVLNDGDFELYNSRSATEDNQKARLLIPLGKPLCYGEWRLAQEVLNDKLEALGIIPDRASERAAQLCYLPNRGELYGCDYKRNNKYFDPQFWAQEIACKSEKLEADRLALATRQHPTMAKKAALKLTDAPDLIGAFNIAYTVQEWLLQAGYEQRGSSFRHPNSESGSYSAGIDISTGRVNALSPNDPLYSEGNGAHDAFSVYTTLFHGKDRDAALKAAGDDLLAIDGVAWNKAAQRLFMQEKERQKSKAEQAQHEQEPEGANTRQRDGLQTRSMSKIKMKAIKWLWSGWIPRGYVTLWAGESGAGKTSILADIVARESTGAPWPGETEHRTPGRILWLGSEDGMADLTVPRLVANGADLRQIDEITPHTNGDSFSLQDDIAKSEITLKAAVNAGNPCTMLIIDPVTSYLPGKRIKNINSIDASNIRAIMEPWLRLAETYSLAVVCVTHFAKDTNRSMMARVLGSTAFVQTCRSLVVVLGLPDVDNPYSKGMLQIKNNLPKSPKGGWRLETVSVKVSTDKETGEDIEATKPEWLELDPLLTQDNFMTTKSGAKPMMPELFIKAVKEALESKPEGVEEHFLKSFVIERGISERWWKNNNCDYLTKVSEGRAVYCKLQYRYRES